MDFILALFINTILIAVCLADNKCFEESGIYNEFRVAASQLRLVDGKTECLRKCDGKPYNCYYKLIIEPYTTMGPACGDCPKNKTNCFAKQCVTGDGFEKPIKTYNRTMPGPLINVCRGDMITVDVVNHCGDISTTIHWHGIRQHNSQYSDGVPFVTQCPILPGQTFRYLFNATDAGTFFYHSHSGLQKVDGLTGPLIVREIKYKEPFGGLYDYDTHIVVQDVLHGPADTRVPGMRTGPAVGTSPDSYLFNGKGIFVEGVTSLEELTKYANSSLVPPLAEVRVKPGKRIRLRVISSSCLSCLIRFRIQGHKLTLIHVDGAGPVKPTTVDSVSLNSAERFDFIIETKKGASSSFWITAQGEGSCGDAMQLAILRYEGTKGLPSSNLPLVDPNDVVLNPLNPSSCDDPKAVCLVSVESLYPAPPSISNPEVFLTLQFGFHFYTKQELFESDTLQSFFLPAPPIWLKAQINGISNTFPPSALMSQYYEIPDERFCSKKCHLQALNCNCLNVYKVPKNSVVQLTITDTAPFTPNGISHPFHMHGYNFYIVKQGRFSNTSKNPLADGLAELAKWTEMDSKKNKTDFYPISKDTVSIPSGGYVVARFIADNIGFWLLHCHFAIHLDLGMSAVIQVGDIHQMPLPPSGFPKCGDYVPQLYN